MKIFISSLIIIVFVFGYVELVFSKFDDEQNILTYKRHFSDKAYKFGNKNRFNIANINRDKYSNCFMQVGIQVTVAKNGELKSLSVKEPSPVPMIDKYFSYIVKQAAPFDKLNKYFGSELNELTFVEQFRLKLSSYENSKVTKQCK